MKGMDDRWANCRTNDEIDNFNLQHAVFERRKAPALGFARVHDLDLWSWGVVDSDEAAILPAMFVHLFLMCL